MIKSARLNTIIHYLSYLLFILAAILSFPLILSFVYGEGSGLYQSYYYTMILSLLSALLLKVVSNRGNKIINLTTAMQLCAISWIVISFFGAFPFVFALEKSLIDAFFESTAGFTSAGLTVFTGLDYMPNSIIFWRSLMQFLGGLGILTFFLLISTRSGGESWHFFSAEGHKYNFSRPVPNIYRTVKILWSIYIIFVIAETIILNLLGLSFFDALTISFATISTGGFSHYDQSIGHFAANGYQYFRMIEYVIIFFMFLGGVNFLLHFRLFTKDYEEIKNNSEFKTLLKLIFYGTIFISVIIIILNTAVDSSVEEIFRKSFFQVTAIITTTGFSTEAINSSFFPVAARQLFLLFMLIGGSVGSTSGGIKIMRLNILRSLFKREVKKIYYPRHAVLPVTVDKQILSKDEIYRLTGLVTFWLILIVIGGIITALFSDLNGLEAYSTMFSALGNIGPSFVSVERMTSLSPLIKFLYIIAMLAGRLEILPLIILFSRRAWKS